MKCPLCGDEGRHLIIGKTLKSELCACGMMFLRKYPTEVELHKFYNGVYRTKTRETLKGMITDQLNRADKAR